MHLKQFLKQQPDQMVTEAKLSDSIEYTLTDMEIKKILNHLVSELYDRDPQIKEVDYIADDQTLSGN